ncbi:MULTISPECIES: MerR family transcriptional regulator [unclassified Streptomyces]|uniref:MerR family transcriptional regulator n=1 Tax=unclassified Streptomyces TaxID=2593676 RepID=UPI002DDC18B0|nr:MULTISPECIES: MerR family transcriptional regulator [unclassified Streptomyces]WSA93668.1 MerR family transcriptional regulator [Streptomyces sp. NBC_01795]WSB78040.1 MerR family transcriptional regulator [Streptomyces sp. NBC_01775]WSS13708.1 MerR family transcriptional regulator [Streptomyces sp. NBC_01186]WSS42530.1 MerR family transcriptional regulator [Streptomyces sp. NBC_01187]
MRIGELARRAGVSVRALRYYEEQHLLLPERSPSGQRLYGDEAVGRVRMLQELYAAGLPSRKILELLPCLATGEVTPELVERLAAERNRIDRQIHDLRGTRERLDAIIATSASALDRGENRCASNWRAPVPHPAVGAAGTSCFSR